MKNGFAIILIALLLCGCTGPDKYETVGNICAQEVVAVPKTIVVDIPDEATSPVLVNEDNSKLYLCNGYSLCIQTLRGGNIDLTLKNCTGFDRNNLEVIETSFAGLNRYDCAWSAVGEEADQILRLAVLDDGMHHYVITAMAPAETAGKMSDEWNDLFASIKLRTDQ